MRDYPITVLKFGSSVLRSEADLPAAVHEIYRWVRQGHRVIAVVSALGRSTDELLSRAKAYGDGVSEPATAALVATGESTSAALLGLALDRSGIPSVVFDEVRLGLLTSGSPLDSTPLELNRDRILSALEHHSVVVAPGFLGRQSDGSISLLGRGGSDLTAVFIAHKLQAVRCRLIKDVDGIFEHDPATSPVPPRRYRHLHFRDAKCIDSRVVQAKAIEYGASHDYPVEVASLNSENPTIIGPQASEFYGEHLSPEPLRIGLLGAGVVGLGVYRALSSRPHSFHVTGIGVRRTKRDDGTPPELLTRDPWEVLRTGCQVVVELLGGLTPARELIEAALRSGQHVITANKLVIARHGEHLLRVARDHNVVLRYSAAVGGGVPMIEEVSRLASTQHIRSIQGVVNGTTNFILDRIAAGDSPDGALREAQRLGFAEQDPTSDLDGTDAAHKIALLAQTAFGAWIHPGQILKRGINSLDADSIRTAASHGKAVRLLGTLSRTRSGIEARVEPAFVERSHAFARIQNEGNCLQVETDRGVLQIRGKGAGRWPTTESVMADIFDIHRSADCRIASGVTA